MVEGAPPRREGNARSQSVVTEDLSTVHAKQDQCAQSGKPGTRKRSAATRAMLAGETNGLWPPRAAYTWGRFR
jgi:hypothetical protein